MNKLVILGFGGFGKTIEDVVLSGKLYDEIIFLDDKAKGNKVVGCCSDFKNFIDEDTFFYPAFGNNNLRIEWINMLICAGAQVATIIHPQSYVSPSAIIETGCAILPNATVNTSSIIKKGCIVNFGAVVDHDCVIEKGVHLCPNCVIKAYNKISPLCKVEAGKIILNNTFKLEKKV